MADHAFQPAGCPLQQVDIWAAAGRAALSEALGFQAPEEIGQVTQREGVRVACLSPRRFWIIGNTPLVTIAPEHGTSLRLDEGRVSLLLPAAEARGLFSQLMAIDWQDQRAAPGRIILSAIHRVPVAVLPRDDRHYELIMPRSFAESLAGLLAELQAA